jgi:cell wall-associated NlpC family hydrolase
VLFLRNINFLDCKEKMKKIILLVILTFFSISCKSTKNLKQTKQSSQDKIVNTAQSYIGTKYKYGGTTHKGMDCSGLIYVAYGKEHIQLPRTSFAMAQQGKTISLKQIKKGDLVFFSTGRKKKINHVGLVSKVSNSTVYFIHASSSRGVMTSSLSEKYYKKHFIKAKRIL